MGFLYSGPSNKATTHIVGASCLLCYGVASALTSSLDTHLETTIGNDELLNIKNLVLSEYSSRVDNVNEISIAKPIGKLSKFKGELGFAKRDFRFLKESQKIDVLVVLQLNRHGAYRSFSNYFPNGDPLGYVAGVLYAVDLNSNAYIQYLDVNEKVQPIGEWDEPTQFPSVTTSYYQAIENVKEKVRDAI